MTAKNQDFATYQGDAALPVFTVLDENGAPINLSTATQISWAAKRDAASSPVLAKTKSGGGISFVTDGSDGKFQVALTGVDTAALTGYYLHVASVTDALGNTSTVTLGRMQVGIAPVWTYSGDPSLNPRDAVRYYIGDTDSSNPQMFDGEIDYVLTQFPSPLYAAAQCARTMVTKVTKQVTSKKVGDLAISYSDAAKNWQTVADDLQAQAEMTGVSLYVGGISRADMAAVDGNQDRVKPPFSRKQFDIPGGTGVPSTGDERDC